MAAILLSRLVEHLLYRSEVATPQFGQLKAHQSSLLLGISAFHSVCNFHADTTRFLLPTLYGDYLMVVIICIHFLD